MSLDLGPSGPDVTPAWVRLGTLTNTAGQPSATPMPTRSALNCC
ncbi:hypothetical protein [Luteitalea pratensis]|nr:hypothetical protein [Luteitalea pratensis]